jgi:cytochrome c
MFRLAKLTHKLSHKLSHKLPNKLLQFSAYLQACFLLLASVFIANVYAQNSNPKVNYPSIGRNATSAEIQAWDIDVRADFKGLPKGAGSVEQGQLIWEAKCASCHGTFGESNEVFTPIVGGTSKEDIQTGRVASLTSLKQPQRTTLMKVATISTLWDYIYRAMPWNAPRSLSADDTYALVAYILSLGEIVADGFVLSDANIAEIQKKMPNRNGMSLQHGLWQSKGKPDVKNTACMNNCVSFVQIGSVLPDYARNAHHNLALQNREYGPYRGVDTTKPPLAALPTNTMLAASTHSALPSSKLALSPGDIFKRENCSACHAANAKLVGPSIAEIARKYQGQSDAQVKLINKVKVGGAGIWGPIPMPAQAQVSEADIQTMVNWILTGK